MACNALLLLLGVTLLLSAAPRAAADVADTVCDALGGMCKQTFKIPTAAAVEYKETCTNKCCKWPCNQPFNIPCTGCSKSKCGEACTKIPDTLRVKYDELSACSAAKAALPPLDPEKIVSLCPCLKKASAFVADVGGDVSSPARLKTDAVARAAELSSCLVTSGFNVQSNEASQRESFSRDAAADVIVEAPKVDTAFYTSLAAAVGGCAAGGGTCDTIPDLFLKYFESAGSAVGKGLASYVKDGLVPSVFGAVLSPLQRARDLAAALPAKLEQQAASCGADAAAALRGAAGELEGAAKALAELDSFVESGKKLMETAGGAADALSDAATELSKSYSEHLKDLASSLLSGQAPDFADPIKFLTSNSGGLKDAITAAQQFAKSAPDAASAAAALPAAAAAVSKAVAALSALQGSAAGCGASAGGELSALQGAVDDAARCLKSVSSLDVNANTLQAGVLSYNRWIDISMDMPCSKMDTKEFAVAGLKVASVPYPKFWACKYTNKLAMPNEHIPYLRLKGLKAAGCGAAAPPAPASGA